MASVYLDSCVVIYLIQGPEGLSTETFDLATELRALHRVKTPDALHLATAILGECQEFWTNDLRLTVSAQNRIKVRAFS